MALIARTLEGRNEDGSRRFNNSWTPLKKGDAADLHNHNCSHCTDEGDSEICVIQTGPVQGSLSLADGAVYGVGPDHIQVHPQHFADVHMAIAKMHEASGHLDKLHYGDELTDDSPPVTVGAGPDGLPQVQVASAS